MADQRDGGIAWTDESWNPVRGCSRVSEGCRNCYAERVAARFSDGPKTEDTYRGTEIGRPQPYHGLAKRTPSGARWTGVVRLVPEHLADPLRWRRPRRVFVNSMSDLFHESLSDEDIDAVLAVMLVAPKHTFQVLTKRAARMREYFAAPGLYDRVLRAAGPLRVTFPETIGVGISNPGVRLPPWIWLGVSVEDQQRADERIPHLLATPAAVRWVSYEPAIGPVDFGAWVSETQRDALSWIVVGGESGPGARPFDIAWAREVLALCREEPTPVFVKQLGADVRARNDTGWERMSGDEGDEWSWPIEDPDQVEDNPNGCREEYQGAPVRVRLRDRKGGDPAEWPPALRVREFPEVPRAR